MSPETNILGIVITIKNNKKFFSYLVELIFLESHTYIGKHVIILNIVPNIIPNSIQNCKKKLCGYA